MTSADLPPFPPYSSLPPVHPQRPVFVKKETVWPKVVGIIAIVLAALGLVGGGCGALAPLTSATFVRFFESMGPQMQVNVQQFRAMQDHVIALEIVAVLALAVSGLMMAVGIGILKRRPWARRASMIFIPFKMIEVIVALVIQIPMQQAQLSSLSTSPGGVPVSGLGETFLAFGIVFAILFGWAFPIFLLVWLLRRPVREEMAAWRVTRASSP